MPRSGTEIPRAPRREVADWFMYGSSGDAACGDAACGRAGSRGGREGGGGSEDVLEGSR